MAPKRNRPSKRICNARGTTWPTLRRAIFTAGLLFLATVVFLRLRKGDAPPRSVEPRASASAASARAAEVVSEAVPLQQESTGIHSQDDEPKGTLALRGRVLDVTDRPAANAIVAVNTTPRRTVMSASDGTFEFTGLLPRPYAVVARRGALVSPALELPLAADSPPITLLLRESSALEALVADAADNHPIASARIEVEDEGVVATTDKHGRATLTGLAPGGYVLGASGDGYTKARVLVSHSGAAGTSPVLMLLTQGAAAHGRVVDGAGEPVSGATVRALRGSTLAVDDRATGAEVTTDSTGFWTIPALPAGTFRFAAAHVQFAPALSPSVAVDGSEPAGPIVITMEKGAELVGRVVTRSGTAAPFALVDARSTGVGIRLPSRRTTFADASGHFKMIGLPRATLNVEARADEGTAPPQLVNLESGHAEVTLTLLANGVIAGSVVGRHGDHIAGAQVVAISDDRALLGGFADSKAGRYASAVTNDRGAFRLRGLSAGRYRLRSSKSMSVQATQFWLQPGVLAEVGDEDARVVVEEPGRLKGRVELARGGVPESFSVAITLSAPEYFNGKQGTFVVNDVPAGRHTVTIASRGSQPRVIEDVDVRAGEDNDLGRIVLESGITVRGTVVDKNDTPVAEATVIAGASILGDGKGPSGGGLRAKTDRGGQFAIDGAVSGPLTLVAEHATLGRSVPLEVMIGQEPPPSLQLRLAPTAALQGHVTKQRRPLDRVGVVAAPNGSPTGRFAVTTQADGLYQFERLSEGDYLVSTVLRMSPTVQLAQVVRAKVGPGGGNADIDVAIGGPTVAFDVRDSAGQPISNGQIFLATGNVRAASLRELEAALSARGAGQTRIVLLMQGRAEATTDVPPGPYSVCAAPIFGNLEDPTVTQRIRDHAGELAVTCVPMVVEPEPPVQRASLQVAGGGVR
jgi:hypothetical protein